LGDKGSNYFFISAKRRQTKFRRGCGGKPHAQPLSGGVKAEKLRGAKIYHVYGISGKIKRRYLAMQ
jgi:hypothetical protein